MHTLDLLMTEGSIQWETIEASTALKERLGWALLGVAHGSQLGVSLRMTFFSIREAGIMLHFFQTVIYLFSDICTMLSMYNACTLLMELVLRVCELHHKAASHGCITRLHHMQAAPSDAVCSLSLINGCTNSLEHCTRPSNCVDCLICGWGAGEAGLLPHINLICSSNTGSRC